MTYISIGDVQAYIWADASAEDIERIYTACKERNRLLKAQRAAEVSVGTAVTLRGLSPKYLNGLTGTVESIKGQRGAITLDEASTETLRWAGKRYYVPEGVTNFVLNGVPLSCCHLVEVDA